MTLTNLVFIQSFIETTQVVWVLLLADRRTDILKVTGGFSFWGGGREEPTQQKLSLGFLPLNCRCVVHSLHGTQRVRVTSSHVLTLLSYVFQWVILKTVRATCPIGCEENRINYTHNLQPCNYHHWHRDGVFPSLAIHACRGSSVFQIMTAMETDTEPAWKGNLSSPEYLYWKDFVKNTPKSRNLQNVFFLFPFLCSFFVFRFI